ncbi:ribose 5-phosphate isomerase B [Candidatus Uabimicrobium amorphum]|uniref:ribose 5-phosphate isomerase B n=1 Tax=Uabimicrobium amorphum TaxID=2596890 RepID=UPI001E2B86FC
MAIGCDHGGFPLKKVLISELHKWGYDVCDMGTHSTDSVDYPDFAHAVAEMVSQKNCIFGIVIDGAGIGSAMTANKVPGVRAAHCHNLFEVKNSKEHNNANVLSLGARVIGEGLAIEMVKTWLDTPFAGGRHQRRVDKIMATERKYLRG